MNRTRTLAVASLLAAASYAAPARACSVCGCGDPLLAASDPAAINGQLRLQLDTEYLRVDAGTDGVQGSTDRLKQWSYRFNVVYRPIESLAFTATVPLVSKQINAVGPAGETPGSDLTGLGDVEVAARYTVWRTVNLGRQRAQEFALSAGTAIPTGSYNATTGGELIDPHGQLGTGGWGPFLGLNYLFEQGDWLAFANVSGRLRTEATYFDGSKYKFGDALLWSVHGQYRPLRRLALDLGVDGRYAKVDRATLADAGALAETVGNTGGTVLSAAPGVYFNATGPLWLFVRGQLPFYKSLFGEQDVLPSFTTGIQFQPL